MNRVQLKEFALRLLVLALRARKKGLIEFADELARLAADAYAQACAIE